jgi:hypothetical protein
MKVDVYFNLHKKCLSVRHKGKVVHHSDYVKIINPTFVVSQAGRQRVLREKRKNVHAFVRGELAALENNPKDSANNLQTITYNPYKYSTFVTKNDETPVHKASEVHIFGRHILANLA